MTKKEAIAIFGSGVKLADALGIKPQAVYQWGDDIPELREHQIRKLESKIKKRTKRQKSAA